MTLSAKYEHLVEDETNLRIVTLLNLIGQVLIRLSLVSIFKEKLSNAALFLDDRFGLPRMWITNM